MPEERAQFGRFENRDDGTPCASPHRRPHDRCSTCAARTLRPYRVVKRYRGDRAVGDFVAGQWCDLWRLQAGDVSWPHTREL
ncbi:MAG: hypothetical protein AB7P40_05815 [Chloroflexota bacterium]